ncbi:MAG: hypothetical protein M1827_000106 [Pycnora praestabilis]|nr:MAG: hypothetical protein M1827_000106 [Pycnora praestabilis]
MRSTKAIVIAAVVLPCTLGFINYQEAHLHVRAIDQTSDHLSTSLTTQNSSSSSTNLGPASTDVFSPSSQPEQTETLTTYTTVTTCPITSTYTSSSSTWVQTVLTTSTIVITSCKGGCSNTTPRASPASIPLTGDVSTITNASLAYLTFALLPTSSVSLPTEFAALSPTLQSQLVIVNATSASPMANGITPSSTKPNTRAYLLFVTVQVSDTVLGILNSSTLVGLPTFVVTLGSQSLFASLDSPSGAVVGPSLSISTPSMVNATSSVIAYGVLAAQTFSVQVPVVSSATRSTNATVLMGNDASATSTAYSFESSIPLYLPEMLGNAYGGGYATIPSLFVSASSGQLAPLATGAPPGYGSSYGQAGASAAGGSSNGSQDIVPLTTITNQQGYFIIYGPSTRNVVPSSTPTDLSQFVGVVSTPNPAQTTAIPSQGGVVDIPSGDSSVSGSLSGSSSMTGAGGLNIESASTSTTIPTAQFPSGNVTINATPSSRSSYTSTASSGSTIFGRMLMSFLAMVFHLWWL